MANYIHTLQDANEAKEEALTHVEGMVIDFMKHLQSDKFTHGDNWISVQDVQDRLQDIRSKASLGRQVTHKDELD